LTKKGTGSSIEVNCLSLISIICGLIILISLAIYWLLAQVAFSSSSENLLEPGNRLILTIMDASVTLRNLCALIALVTGILALREKKNNDGNKKDKIFAWIGIALGAGWILFGMLVGIIFLLAKILHGVF